MTESSFPWKENSTVKTLVIEEPLPSSASDNPYRLSSHCFSFRPEPPRCYQSNVERNSTTGLIYPLRTSGPSLGLFLMVLYAVVLFYFKALLP